jgi:hypothetical protein
MLVLILTVLAPIGAWIHLRRHPEPRGRKRTLEIYLLWWLALAIGAASVFGALFHVFDGPAIAEMIGFTRGDGGFQFENAMGDLAIGVTGLLCIRIRGTFWLAVLLVASIQYYGDAYGHVYQWLHNDNTEPDNIGIPLWQDLIVPTVGLALYMSWKRAVGSDRRDGAATTPNPPPRSTPTATGEAAGRGE